MSLWPGSANCRHEQMQQEPLLDQLIGAQEKRFGDCQAEGLGGGQINDELEFGRQKQKPAGSQIGGKFCGD